MEKEIDLSKMKSRPNPYAERLKQQISVLVDTDVVDYFTQMAEETGIPYQNLINLYLRDCVTSQRKVQVAWSG